MKTFASPGLDALATAVLFLDRGGAIDYANAAAENLLKLSTRSILGHRLEEVFPDAAPLLAAVQYAQAHHCGYTQHDLILATAAAEKLELTCTVTPAEIDAFLAEAILARLATANPKTCQPHAVPVWFLWDGESAWISAFTSTGHPPIGLRKNLWPTRMPASPASTAEIPNGTA